MNFHDDIHSLPFDIFKCHYVLDVPVFDLTSVQDATEIVIMQN